MKAIAATGPSTDALIDIDLPQPVPGPQDLLVRVEAISVNPIDTKRRAGIAAGGPPQVLGWDAAGTVVSVGAEVSLFKPGDACCYAGDITRPGCNSEYHLVDERLAGRKPASLGFAAAAALPLTTITAWESLFDRMCIDVQGAQRGDTLLVINGAGGVGSIAIQLAKLAGLKVVATASRPESIDWCRQMGADEVVDHRGDLAGQLGRQVEYVANFSGDLDAHWPAMAELVAPQGRLVSIVGNTAPLAMDALRAKSASLSWELMFTRPRYKTRDMIQHHRLLSQVAAWMDEGRLQPTLRETPGPINAANLRLAHARLASGTMTGKLALQGW
ncbi:MAG: zinc-binding alcohol dehydrogenase family protein [Pseudomonadota bacterium]